MKRKRAPGGGRKPKVGFSTSSLTIRIPDDLRKQLESEATTTHDSIAQRLLWHLRQSMSRQRDKDRDPAMRGLCFLIAQLAHHITGPHLTDGKRELSLYDWRSDPFFYRAFKLAVGQLLDALEPPGPIRSYEVKPIDLTDRDPHLRHYVESFKSPEAKAQYVVEYVLAAFRQIPALSDQEREQAQRELLNALLPPSMKREFYAMPDAARDLAIKAQSGKTTKAKIDLTLLFT